MGSEAKRQGERESQGDGTPSGLRQAGASLPSRSCWFCDGAGKMPVAASYVARRSGRVVDEEPRLEVCYACLGTGKAS